MVAVQLSARVIFGLFVYLTSSLCCQGQETTEDATIHSTQELVLQYARTRLQLAETELARASESNAQYPGIIPRFRVERLRSNLEIAREGYQQAISASTGGPEKVRLKHAEEDVRLADLHYQEGKKSHSEGKLSDLALKQLDLQHRLAKLKLALLRSPENYATLLQSMQNQIDRFGEEILTLDQRLARLESIEANR
jgi:hypothetical protein